MSRPWVIWAILLVCALAIVGAMAWLTGRTLEIERERVEVEARSMVEERVRLALSRMDAAASGLLVIENQRPPEHYRGFYAPKLIFTNQLENIGGSQVVEPSPLLSAPPEFVRLHFEVWANDELTSPQVPVGSQRKLAEASGVQGDAMDEAARRLQRLRDLLARPVAGQALNRTKPQGSGGDNLDRLISACLPDMTAWNAQPTEQLAPASPWGTEELKEVLVQGYAKPRVEAAYQQELTQGDRGKRIEFNNDVQFRAAQNAMNYGQFSKGRSDGLARGEADSDKQRATKDELLPNIASGNLREIPPVSAPSAAGDAAARHAGSGVAGWRAAAAEDDVDLEVKPFVPVWIDGELMAVRQVRSERGVRYQGFWLDAVALRQALLDRVADLLPQARLTPIATSTANGPTAGTRSLVTLPWLLEEGIDLKAGLAGVAPLPGSLVSGWLAVLVALLAAAVLVRGVMRMSERRAAFVSSVTHELRTPLTTFQLYSDLLAEGMVRDEAKRQHYLETMRSEAVRLNHLIENVLAYSRIERGSARGQRVRLTVGELVGRMEQRLRDRAMADGADFAVVGLERCADVEFETDVTAVGQIIFNLVDNACKYGLPEHGQRPILLQVSCDARYLGLAVCDHGGGILRHDRRRLFKPFHKSASDAANSKPGVGLGLALCRRLARALGGDVTVDASRQHGACFTLKLPRTSRGC